MSEDKMQTNDSKGIIRVKMPSALDLAIQKRFPGVVKRDSWISSMKKVSRIKNRVG